MAQSVKIVQLAARVGLDKSTVSRALNNRPGVASATRERVLCVAREMGYAPNIHGQGLRGWSSRTLVLVVSTGLTPGFYGALTLELHRAANDRSYDLLITSPRHHPGQSIGDVVQRRGGVGGVLLGPQAKEVLEDLWRSRMPCVQVDDYCDEFPGMGRVASANQASAYRITRHLLDLGHRRLAFAGDPGRLAPYRERYAGFTQALTEAGLQEVVADGLRADEYEYAHRLLRSRDCPTGVVAASDRRAAMVLGSARELGRHIPRDLSVTGFDDVDRPFVESIGLTTVRVDLAGLAEAAVEGVLTPVGKQRFERRVATESILRTSTGPPSQCLSSEP